MLIDETKAGLKDENEIQEESESESGAEEPENDLEDQPDKGVK